MPGTWSDMIVAMFQSSSVGDDGWNKLVKVLALALSLFQSSSVGDDGWNPVPGRRRERSECFNPHPSEMTDGTPLRFR